MHSSPEQELDYEAGTTDLRRHHRPARRRRRRVARPRGRDRASSRCADRDQPTVGRRPTTSPRPRDRRREGPADLARAGDRRRGRRADHLLHGPRGRLAHPAVRRRDRRPAGAGLARRLVDSHRLAPSRCACSGSAALPATSASPRSSARTCSINPVFGHVLRPAVGGPGARCRCCSDPSGRRSARSARSAAASRRLGAHRPRDGAARLSRAARLLAGRGRAVRVRLARAGLPPLRPSSARPAVDRAATSPSCWSAARCSATRSTSTPTRSRSTRPWSSRMSVWGRRDGELVVRSPLANLATTPARPGLVAVVAVLFGSTAFDSFKDSPRVAAARRRTPAHRRTCSTTWRCSASASGVGR